MHYYGTFFSMATVKQVEKDLKKRGVKVVKVEKKKPVFTKDKFSYKVYTDFMV